MYCIVLVLIFMCNNMCLLICASYLSNIQPLLSCTLSILFFRHQKEYYFTVHPERAKLFWHVH